jgi:hypothetical protein
MLSAAYPSLLAGLKINARISPECQCNVQFAHRSTLNSTRRPHSRASPTLLTCEHRQSGIPTRSYLEVVAVKDNQAGQGRSIGTNDINKQR